MPKKLIVIAGPTASGKTDLAIRLAKKLHCPVVSADSRQVYKEMQIGTAVPNADDLSSVPHHLIQYRSIHEPCDVVSYEHDALARLSNIYGVTDQAILCGGTGLYIDAVCHGLDELPSADHDFRYKLKKELERKGIVHLQELLREADPDYYEQVDLNNPVRIIRALEVIHVSGKRFSELRKGRRNQRFFSYSKYLLEWPREALFRRINDRVDRMIEEGLVDEARKLYPYKNLKALKTVGYRELFKHFEGQISLAEAIEKIKTNSRRYAKRQMTWFQKDSEYIRIDASDSEQAFEEILRISEG